MTNREALGYMLLAAKEVGLDKNTVRKLYGAMYVQFDLKTEEEADEIGHKWYHDLQE